MGNKTTVTVTSFSGALAVLLIWLFLLFFPEHKEAVTPEISGAFVVFVTGLISYTIPHKE